LKLEISKIETRNKSEIVKIKIRNLPDRQTGKPETAKNETRNL
jgi:hypothetical protein